MYRVADFIGLYPVFVIKDTSKVKVEFLDGYKVKVDGHIGYLYPSQYQELKKVSYDSTRTNK